MQDNKCVVDLFETLVDEKSLIPDSKREEINKRGDKSIGYSQFNEILLLLGFDRVSSSFFQYIVDGSIEYKEGAAIELMNNFQQGVERFIVLALLWYGNIKYAFKILSSNDSELEEKVLERIPWEEKHYKMRHPPVIEIETIPADKTYYLGYLMKDKLKCNNLKDSEKELLLTERSKYLEIGKKNHIAYLSSDHLDVYVATSMRLEHEYIFVNSFISSVFSHENLLSLKIRWFDPTQAYCENRIDKGLSEALMLKRAKCTLYLVQESDTLGKDSELASTLAQGKPVVAYVPQGDKEFVDDLLKKLIELNPEKSEYDIIIEQLEIFKPSLAWHDEKMKNLIFNRNEKDINTLKECLYDTIEEHYNSRANTLQDMHPLGIQVNLMSGVANGVLLVRNAKDCADLIYTILMNNMQFNIETEFAEGTKYVYLREKISNSIFRVKTVMGYLRSKKVF
jgi:hypothetical protein